MTMLPSVPFADVPLSPSPWAAARSLWIAGVTRELTMAEMSPPPRPLNRTEKETTSDCRRQYPCCLHIAYRRSRAVRRRATRSAAWLVRRSRQLGEERARFVVRQRAPRLAPCVAAP